MDLCASVVSGYWRGTNRLGTNPLTPNPPNGPRFTLTCPAPSKVLTAASREQMFRASSPTGDMASNGQPMSYGLGWYVGYAGDQRAVFHGGSLPGFHAQMLRLVDEKLPDNRRRFEVIFRRSEDISG